MLISLWSGLLLGAVVFKCLIIFALRPWGTLVVFTMQFRDIVGQEDVKRLLAESVRQQRISHAQLFLGSEGSGSLPLAVAYAQYVMCENRSETDSCGLCKACRKVAKLAHPDLHFVYPVATSAKVKSKPVSDSYSAEWRNLMVEQAYFSLTYWLELIGTENKQGIIGTDEAGEIIRKLNLKTFEAEYKVMVIWMPEKMNDSSANKLLKMIEEPPSKTLFLLVAENGEQIIQTILSRTQLVKVPRIAQHDMVLALRERLGANEEAAHAAARIAAGNYIKAYEAVKGSAAGEAFFETFTEWMRVCYAHDIQKIMELVARMDGWSREMLKNFLNYCSAMLRENLILNQCAADSEQLSYMNRREMEFSERFNRFVHPGNIHYIFQELELAHQHIARNGSERLVLLDLSLKLTQLLRR